MRTFEDYWDALPRGRRKLLAARLSRHPVYLEAVAHRRKAPSFALAQAIARETGVALASWGDIGTWATRKPKIAVDNTG